MVGKITGCNIGSEYVTVVGMWCTVYYCYCCYILLVNVDMTFLFSDELDMIISH